jgi:hypothetical protein
MRCKSPWPYEYFPVGDKLDLRECLRQAKIYIDIYVTKPSLPL